MVLRSRLLLSRRVLRLGLGLVGLSGCKAESLGVELARGGPDQISGEDLQRDVWLLMGPVAASRAPGSPGNAEAAGRFEERLQQMHTLPAFGQSYRRSLGQGWLVCGQKDGRSDRGLLFFAEDGGAGVRGGALPVASLISLAKAADILEPPTHTLLFCGAFGPGGLDAYALQPAFPLAKTLQIAEVGPLGDADVTGSPEAPLGGAPRQRYSTGPRPGDGGPEDRAEAVDFRRVSDQLREVWLAVGRAG